MSDTGLSLVGLLLLNASLLLAIGFLFEVFGRAPLRTWARQCLVGLGLSAIAIAVMTIAIPLHDGVRFDVRPVVFSISGLFFGAVPTLIAMAGASLYRWYLGGVGAYVGILVILFCGSAGLIYRRLANGNLAAVSAWHLWAFGILINGAVLAMQLALPGAVGPDVIAAVAAPVLLVFPLATMSVGWLLVSWLRREIQARRAGEPEEQLRLLAEHARDLIYRYEFVPNLRFTYISASALSMTGYTPEEFYRDPTLGLRMVVESDGNDATTTLLRSLAESSKPVLLQWRRKDGRLIWTEQQNFLVRDDQGLITALEGVARDVTDREEALALLRRREGEYRGLFESHPTPMWVLDSETLKFLAVNHAAVRHYGYSHEEFLAMTIADIPPSEDVPRLLTKVESVRQGARIDGEVWRHRTKSGRLIDVEVYGDMIEFDGRRAGLVMARDITEERAAGRERERLVAAIEQSPDSIVITDDAGAIIYVNPAFERESGYTRSEAVGQNPRILKSGQQEAEFYREMWITLKSGRVWTGRLVNRRKDGTLYTEDASIAPVRDSALQTIAYVAVKRDVTRQISLEHQYLQAQKMESVGRLAAGVAHDFNNLLTIINSSAELALLDVDPSAQVAEDLRQIQAAGTRASALTRQLLAFSRQQIVKPIVLAPDDVVDGFRKMLRRLVKEDIHIDLTLGATAARVRMDPGQLEQIMMNLVVNARDAMPGGGVLRIHTAEVLLSDAQAQEIRPPLSAGAFVQLSVVDSGCGMTAEVLQQLFTPFFTTKDIGKGTGLGLSTVLRIVTEAGGGLSVTSSPSAGSTFDVYLPVVSGLPAQPVEAESGSSTERQRARVLVVEDEEFLRQLAVRVLEQAGHVVHQASNGQEALEVIERVTGDGLDLVMTDVIMPIMGGRELAERIRASQPSLRLLYTSGYTSDAELTEWLSQSKAPFLAKPYSPDGLLRAIGDVLAAPGASSTPSHCVHG